MSRPCRLKESASQTAGPYVHIGATPNFAEVIGVYERDLAQAMVDAQTRGERVVLTGRVLDGLDTPVRDAVVEIWQADAAGLYPGRGEHRGAADPHFTGFGRQPTDAVTGVYRFETIKPGRVPYPDGRPMAPHVSLWIVARGINVGLHTRLYFGDETEANAQDPVLARIEHEVRRATLIAPRAAGEGTPTYTFDVRLQGERETVFLDV